MIHSNEIITQARSILTVINENKEILIEFIPGLSALEIIEGSEIGFSSVCKGTGVCGRCRIIVENDILNSPSSVELSNLTSEELKNRIRLACQYYPQNNVKTSLLKSVLVSKWWNFPPGESYNFPFQADPETNYSVAIDIGTTHIRIALLDIDKKVRIAMLFGLNPQLQFGFDVLTRLMKAVNSKLFAQKMSFLLIESIAEALKKLFMNKEYFLKNISNVLIVGNTAMLTLMSGRNYDLLINPEYWMSYIDCDPLDTKNWKIAWDISENAEVNIISPLAGFVGSDLLADIFLTNLTEGPPGSLLIDFGTNSEIALWDGKKIWVTSAAGGPAFEGNGISCGMPAEPGAIYRLKPVNFSPVEFSFKVIGDIEAQGISGSGLVDLISNLVSSDIITSSGRFRQRNDVHEIIIYKGKNSITLKNRDIDVFQRAKAGIGAAIVSIIKKSQININSLQRICVCGAFGQFLDINNAQAIGLLPEIMLEKIELYGNGALEGCEKLILLDNYSGSLDVIKKQIQVFNLANDPFFEENFIQNLYLQPITMKGVS